MTLLAVSVAICVIAACQCFHVFKLYTKLVAMEALLNSILIKTTVKEIIKQPTVKKESKKTTSPLFTRTEEQKRHAAQKRREWWERKRAQDALKASEPQTVGEVLDH